MKKVNIEYIGIEVEGPEGKVMRRQAPAFDWHGTMIIDPTMSDCGRFEVDPATYYGLDEETIKMFDEVNFGTEYFGDNAVAWEEVA